jgi:hypothetical protein
MFLLITIIITFHQALYSFHLIVFKHNVIFCGLVVIVLASGPKVRGLKPG